LNNLITGKQALHAIGAVLDFREKTITIDSILLPTRNIVNLQIKPSVRILDAKYDKADLPEIVRTSCPHLTPSERDMLKTNLETNEFASNPPFSKIYPNFRGNDVKNLAHFLAGTMDLKKLKTWNFNKKIKFGNSCEKTFSNNLVFEPMTFPTPPMSDPTKVWYTQIHRHCSQMQDFYFYWSLVHRHCPSRPLSTAPLLR